MRYPKDGDEPGYRRGDGSFERVWRRLMTVVFYRYGYRLLHGDHPWFTPGAIRHLRRLDLGDARIFEWGSGASSPWFARLCGSYIGVEHDPRWHRRVSSQLQRAGCENAQVLLRELNQEGQDPAESPYCREILAYPEGHFDLICMDGRRRESCAPLALSRIRPGGYFVLDDSFLPKYEPILALLDGWERSTYDFGMLQTMILRKP